MNDEHDPLASSHRPPPPPPSESAQSPPTPPPPSPPSPLPPPLPPKASFSWAWLLDERPEERARGVTVDVAVSGFQTPAFNVTLLDALGTATSSPT